MLRANFSDSKVTFRKLMIEDSAIKGFADKSFSGLQKQLNEISSNKIWIKLFTLVLT